MDHIGKASLALCMVVTFANFAQAGQYCGKDGDQEFYCDKGHCCGDFKCCTYYRYYEMWWFWLIWCIIIMLGCSCVYYRRTRGDPYSYLSSFFYPAPSIPAPRRTIVNPPNEQTSFNKLPSYEETIRMPHLGPPNDIEGAPPPYASFAENPVNYQTNLNCCPQYSAIIVTTVSTEIAPQTERNTTIPQQP